MQAHRQAFYMATDVSEFCAGRLHEVTKKKIEFLEFFFIFALAGGERLQKKDFLENSFLLILRCQVAQDTKKGFICIYIYIYNIYIYIARAGGAGCAQQIRGVRAR